MNELQREFLWDVETDLLNEIAFTLQINTIEELNEELYKKGKDYRASYTTLSDFIKTTPENRFYKEYIEKAKIIIRKDKLNKIIENVTT